MVSQRLLVVEDHRAIIDVIRFTLKADPDARAFMIVGEARNGETALRLCNQLQPDLVVMDVFLPDQTGIEVARQMLVFNLNLKILFYTAAQESVFMREAFFMGASGYLCKHEAGIDDLVDALKQCVAVAGYFPQTSWNGFRWMRQTRVWPRGRFRPWP